MKRQEELKSLRVKSPKELYNELNKSYQKLRELKFALVFRKLKDIRQIHKTRRKIARIWSILSEKLNK